MAKPTTNSKRVETWTLNKGTKQQEVIVKIAVRNHLGQFHGATNFKDKAR